MVVAMRLMRMGTTHNPVYRISVGDSRKAPTAKFIEHIGTYNPRPDKMGHKQLRLNVARAKYWIAMGCQPSSMVARLLSRFHLLPVPPARINLTTGSMLHRALAGEDLRPELRVLAGLKPVAKDTDLDPNAEEDEDDKHDDTDYMEAMIRRHPTKDRRMKELTPQRIAQVQRQSRWMLQAFPFDPSPSLATLAAWDQARRFHRVIPQREPLDDSNSFRDQLQATHERRVRMKHAAEDAENGRQRTLAMLTQDAADRVAEIDWVRAQGLPDEQYDEIVNSYMQRERESAQKKLDEQATETAARHARMTERAAAIAADKAAGRERDAAALAQDAADDEAEAAYRLLRASAKGGRTPSRGEREDIVQNHMQAERDAAEARLLSLDSVEMHQIDDPDMIDVEATEEIEREEAQEQKEMEELGENEEGEVREIDDVANEIDDDVDEDAPIDPNAVVISELDRIKLSAEEIAELEADEDGEVEGEIEGEPKKAAAIEAAEAKEGEVAEAKEGEEATPAAEGAEAEADKKVAEPVEEVDEATAALLAEKAALEADPDFALVQAHIKALGLAPTTEVDDEAERAALFAYDRAAELELKNHPEESIDALNAEVVERVIVKQMRRTDIGGMEGVQDPFLLSDNPELARIEAEKAEKDAKEAAKKKAKQMDFNKLTPRQREQLLVQKLHADEEAARVAYVAQQREALQRNQAKSRQEVRPGSGPLVLEPVDMAAIRFDDHLQRSRAEGQGANATARAEERELDEDEEEDIDIDESEETDGVAIEGEGEEEVDLEELHADESLVDAAEAQEVEEVMESAATEEVEEEDQEFIEDDTTERPELEELEEEEEEARRGRKDE